MMKKLLLLAVSEMARIHDWILTLNDGYSTGFSDKQLHFLTIGLFGMLLFFLIHPVFKALAKGGHIIFVSWFYVFTMILGMTFAIEIGQQVTKTGSMEFADIVFGVFGFITLFGLFAILRMIVILFARLFRRNKPDEKQKGSR